MQAVSPRKVIVIGAGVVGVCAASFLRRDGHEVILIDPHEPGQGASFGNAGGLNPASIVPLSMPGVVWNVPKWLFDPRGPLAIRWTYLPMLAPWLIRFLRAGAPEQVEATARALRSLLKPCLETLAPLVREAGVEDLVHRQGGMFVYRSRASLAKHNAGYELRRRHGVVCEKLNADEIRELEPSLSHEYVCGVLIRENANTTNPHRLVMSLAQAFARAGGKIARCKALGFVLDGEKLRAVKTDAGDLAADCAVLAAGIHSRALARALGDAVPLESERGYHLMIRNPEVTTRLSVMDGEGRFVATPMEAGLCVAGTVELASVDAPPNWNRARIMLDHAQRMLPGLSGKYGPERLSTWMGHRPSLPDSLPVIGRSRLSPGVLYAFGHGHVGMTAAPMTGRVIADLVAGRPAAIDIAPFRADRFYRSFRVAPPVNPTRKTAEQDGSKLAALGQGNPCSR